MTESVASPLTNRHPQFGVASLFWTTLVAGMALGYLCTLQSDQLLIDGFVAVLLSAAVGLVVGGLRCWSVRANGSLSWLAVLSDVLFWAVLIGLFAYLSTAADQRYPRVHRMIWVGVGALTGSVASSCFRDRMVANLLACGVAAGLLMGAFFFLSQRMGVTPNPGFNWSAPDFKFDMVAAPFIGVAVGCFVRLLLWVEDRRRMPRYVTATWLMVAVIVGNLLSR